LKIRARLVALRGRRGEPGLGLGARLAFGRRCIPKPRVHKRPPFTYTPEFNIRIRPLACVVGATTVGATTVAAHHHKQRSRLDRLPRGDLDPLHDPVALGEHLVLHLHRLQHDQHRPRSHRRARRVLDGHHDTGKRSDDLLLAGRRHRAIIAHRRQPR
jgi:hypothetical protein